jgi:cyclase
MALRIPGYIEYTFHTPLLTGPMARYSMRELTALSTFLLLVSVLFMGQEEDYSKVEMKVTKVAGNVYMLEGAGGNIGASVGDDGIVVVDDQYAPLAEKIQTALKGISDKPVRFIINTHYHEDHTGGNLYFQKQAPIIAHDNVRKRLEKGGVAGNGSSVHFEAKPQPAGALPILTFDHDVTVHLNGEDIRALYFPAGHTDGDCIIFFPKSNVVHMGDDFGTYGFPFIDIDSGGSINGMIDAVETVISQLPPDVKVIPGHGPVSSVDDMRAYVKMLKETREVVQTALKQGKTFDDMKRARVLDPWKKYAGEFITEDAYLETLYNSLTGQKNGKFIRHN